METGSYFFCFVDGMHIADRHIQGYLVFFLCPEIEEFNSKICLGKRCPSSLVGFTTLFGFEQNKRYSMKISWPATFLQEISEAHEAGFCSLGCTQVRIANYSFMQRKRTEFGF